MERREYLRGTVAVALGTTIAGCQTDSSSMELFIAGQNGASSVDNEALDDWLDRTADGELTDTERDDIYYMREEEKVARDVYLTLYDEWGLQVHDNISDSEQSHMDAMLSLIEVYELDDPATDTVGDFTNSELQDLYDTLVDWGMESNMDSLKAGCRVEERDIQDIEDCIDRTDEATIETVYENLLKGSRNHLRAFYRVLTRQGGDYEPVIISQEQFDEIANSDWETGKA